MAPFRGRGWAIATPQVSGDPRAMEKEGTAPRDLGAKREPHGLPHPQTPPNPEQNRHASVSSSQPDGSKPGPHKGHEDPR